MIKGLIFLSVLSLAAASTFAAQPAALTDEQIITQDHLWPDKVAVKRGFKLSTYSVAKGDVFTVVSISATGVQLTKPNADNGFVLPFKDTDLIERATKLRQSLTAEQKAMDFKALRERPELWPAEVSIHGTWDFPNGVTLHDGQTVTVTSLADNQLWVVNAVNGKANHIFPNNTDLFARARATMAIPPEKRVPRLTRILQGKLVAIDHPPDGAKPTDPAPGTKYYVLIFAGSQTPELPGIIAELEKFHTGKVKGEVEIILLGLDKAIAERKFPWRVIDGSKTEQLAWLRQVATGPSAFLTVYDAHGQLVPDDNSVRDSNAPAPRLQNLAKIVETKAAPR